MIKWTVERLMKAQGLENANQLALRAGVTYPVIHRIVTGADFDRIDASVLDRLCVTLQCQPGDLLRFVPGQPKK